MYANEGKNEEKIQEKYGNRVNSQRKTTEQRRGAAEKEIRFTFNLPLKLAFGAEIVKFPVERAKRVT